MIINRHNNNRSDIREIAGVEVVTHFTYPGSETEINGSAQMTRNGMVKLNKIWREGAITKHTKVRLVRTLIFSIFHMEQKPRRSDRKREQKIDGLEI